tara:strand:- start:1356 stop:1781 length:426 start_codon:yes stop_codon:yes gene_type:complete
MKKKTFSQARQVVDAVTTYIATVLIIDAQLKEPRGSKTFEPYIKAFFRLNGQEHFVKCRDISLLKKLTNKTAKVKVLPKGYSFEGDDGKLVTLDKTAFTFERFVNKVSDEALANLDKTRLQDDKIDQAQSNINSHITADMF